MTGKLARYKRMLAARTGRDGKPLKNYDENVKVLKAEIASLEARISEVSDNGDA